MTSVFVAKIHLVNQPYVDRPYSDVPGMSDDSSQRGSVSIYGRYFMRASVLTCANGMEANHKAFTLFAALLSNKPCEVKTIPFAENPMTRQAD